MGQSFDGRFPVITVRDMVSAQRTLIPGLGIE